jgi:hypothetical protein
MESIRFFTLPDSDIVFFCSDGCLYVNEAYLEWAAEWAPADAFPAAFATVESFAAE